MFADKVGVYSIENLAAGEYKVLVSSLGFATEERNVRVWDGDQVILDIGLNAGGADLPPIEVSGTVRRQLDDAPLAEATITVANPFNQRLVQNVRTDQQDTISSGWTIPVSIFSRLPKRTLWLAPSLRYFQPRFHANSSK